MTHQLEDTDFANHPLDFVRAKLCEIDDFNRRETMSGKMFGKMDFGKGAGTDLFHN
jgi:hypothetical protein